MGEILFQDGATRHINQLHLDHLLSLTKPIHLGNDENAVLGVSFLKPDDEAWLGFYDLNRDSFEPNAQPVLEIRGLEFFRYHHLDYRPDKPWICQFQVIGMADFNRDGHDDLVLSASAGYELVPRGIWIFDGSTLSRNQTPKVLARKLMKSVPSSPSRCFIRDIYDEKDHKPEILVNTLYPDNWTEYITPEGWPKERRDDRSRILLLKYDPDAPDGFEELRCWEGDSKENLKIAIPGPDMPEGGCYVYRFSLGGTIPSKIEKIDGNELKTVLEPFRAEEELCGVLIEFDPELKFNGIIALSKDGRLHLLDENLNTLNVSDPIDTKPLKLQFVADIIKGNNEYEELLISTNSEIYILSLPDLKILARKLFPKLIRGVFHRRNGESPSDVWVFHAKENQRNDLSETPEDRSGFGYKIRSSTDQPLSSSIITLMAFMTGFLLAGISGYILWTRKNRSGNTATYSDSQRRDALLETLRSVGHGKITTSTLSQLEMVIEHITAGEEPPQAVRDRFFELVTSFREIAWPQLRRIAPAAKEAGISPGLIRDFEASIKILKEWFIDKEQTRLDFSLAARKSVTGALKGVNIHRKKIHEELARHYRCDPLRVLEGMIQSAIPEAKLKGIAIEPLMARIEPGMRAFVDTSALKVVLEDLLANAFQALSDSENKRISLALDTSSERITIDIMDSGPGIPDDIKERIFERGFSTREGGGGLGLYQAAELLDRYQGRIFIFQTSPDQGTTFRIELRRSPLSDGRYPQDNPTQV